MGALRGIDGLPSVDIVSSPSPPTLSSSGITSRSSVCPDVTCVCVGNGRGLAS